MNRSSPLDSPAERTAESSETPEESPFTAYRWGWYFFSLMIPFAGIFIALLLYDQDSRDVRRVGRTCLFIGFSIWILFPVVVLLGLMFVGVLAAFSFVSDMLPTD